jgi:hypothetical protein
VILLKIGLPGVDGHYPHLAFSLSGFQGDPFPAEPIRRFGRWKLRRNPFRKRFRAACPRMSYIDP